MKQEKQEKEHDMCKTRIQKDFIAKNKTKTEQCCDKKTYPKLVLNILKLIEGSTFIYTPWGPNFKKPPWKLHPHVWPCMFIHVAHD